MTDGAGQNGRLPDEDERLDGQQVTPAGQLVEPLFGVRDADAYLAECLHASVNARDEVGVRNLIIGNPDVLWGNHTKKLSDGDRSWLYGALGRL